MQDSLAASLAVLAAVEAALPAPAGPARQVRSVWNPRSGSGTRKNSRVLLRLETKTLAARRALYELSMSVGRKRPTCGSPMLHFRKTCGIRMAHLLLFFSIRPWSNMTGHGIALGAVCSEQLALKLLRLADCLGSD